MNTVPSELDTTVYLTMKTRLSVWTNEQMKSHQYSRHYRALSAKGSQTFRSQADFCLCRPPTPRSSYFPNISESFHIPPLMIHLAKNNTCILFCALQHVTL